MPLSVEVVSAERSEWSGEATMVLAPSVNGQMGIMAGHVPVLAVMVPGQVTVRGAGAGDTTIDVTGGFLSVDHDKVVIVVEELESESGDKE